MTVHRNSVVIPPIKSQLKPQPSDDPSSSSYSCSSYCSSCLQSRSVITRLRGTPCAGILLAMLSGVFFATAGFIVKLVPKVNPIQIVVTRSIVQLFFYMPIMVFGGMHPLGAKGERVTLILRGVFGFLGFALCYVAYRMIPFADASTIVYSAPVYVSLFAFVLLKEECGLFQTLTIGLTIAGVLLISKPTFLFGSHSSGGSITDSTLRLEGSIFAFLSSLCSAASFVLMRRLQKTPSAVVISIISIITIIMGILVLTLIVYFFKNDVGILARGVGIPESPEEILWLIANGLCGVFGQLCLTVSLKIEEAGLVSLGRTFDILMAFIFQVAFLHTEIVHWTSIVGGVIVCFGVCISALRRWLRGKPNEYSVLWMLLNCGISRTQDDDISSNKKLDTNDNRKKNVCCVPSNTSSLETLDGVPSPNQFETVMQQENTIDKSEENIV